MTDLKKMGGTLVVAFSLAALGYGVYGSLESAVYKVGTPHYAVAKTAEKKIEAGQTPSLEELKSLAGTGRNETHAGKSYRMVVLGGLGLLLSRKKSPGYS